MDSPGAVPEAFTLGLAADPNGSVAVVLAYGQDHWYLSPDLADELSDALADAAQQARTTPPPGPPAAAVAQAG